MFGHPLESPPQSASAAAIERNLERLRLAVRGQPHLRNLDRWQSLLDHGDVTGVHRILTGLDRDSIEMREVSPLGGLLPNEERLEALRLMRRDQLEYAIRTACQIIGRPEVIVLDSQAILGTFREDELPAGATMSAEVDILPIADTNEETARLADRIDGVAGEFSPFEELHGFSIDGVDLETFASPDCWRDRLVKVQNANTAGPDAGLQFTSWCLDKEDLCVAKLCALQEKDQNFVSELLMVGPVDPGVIGARLAAVPERYRPGADRAAEWLASGALWSAPELSKSNVARGTDCGPRCP